MSISKYLKSRRYSQVVRQGIANPLPPVQIGVSPLFKIITKILNTKNLVIIGERGIRTLGTKRYVQQISNLPLSTTQPSLHMALAGLEPATLGL